MRNVFLVFTAMVVAMAQTSHAPRLNDDTLARGSALVEQTRIEQGSLVVSGNLPTSCHQLRIWVPPMPDSGGALAVEVYSVTERRQVCAQMLKPFTATVPLTAIQAQSKITVNGKAAGPAER